MNTHAHIHTHTHTHSDSDYYNFYAVQLPLAPPPPDFLQEVFTQLLGFTLREGLNDIGCICGTNWIYIYCYQLLAISYLR